ncbi:MAG: glycosyltransferase [Candidatus Omnitrophica bacterium]|nr:glycosyltransferase [Candidatus Omnitrophota bacterium]
MTNNKRIRLSVVIPTYNRAKDLKKCLDSLLLQTFKDFEILVIDNGSTDETSQLLKEYPVRVIQDSTKNVFHLFNLGWKNSQADIIVFTNDDVETVPGWLEQILITFEQFKGAGAVGGPTVLPLACMNNQEMLSLHAKAQKNPVFKILSGIYESFIMEGKYAKIGVLCESGSYSVGGSLLESTKLSQPISVDLLSITNLAVKRYILEEVGGLDENFMFNHGDGDLFIRMRKNCYQLIFNPKVMVWHYVNPAGNTRGAFWRGRDHAYFLEKDIKPKTLSGKFKLFLNVVFFNLFWVYKAIASKKISYLRGNLGYLKGMSDYYKNKINSKLR